jgi:hypothetical protein
LLPESGLLEILQIDLSKDSDKLWRGSSANLAQEAQTRRYEREKDVVFGDLEPWGQLRLDANLG